MKLGQKELERFRNLPFKVNEKGCWIYLGYICRDGGPIFKAIDKTYSLAKVSYTIFKGEPINFVLHIPYCSDRKCFNPNHLYDGTHKQNMLDREKNKNNKTGSRLDIETAREIRRLANQGHTHVEIANLYNKKYEAISDIVNYKTWKER